MQYMNQDQILQRLDSIEATLRGLREKPLTFAEACAYTGFSKSYLYKLTSAGRIPHYKPEGKRLYFDKGELDRWLLRNPASVMDLDQASTNYLLNEHCRTRTSVHPRKVGVVQ